VKQIFLDCDGVLADFDAAARHLFGMESRAAQEFLGNKEFWRRIRKSGDFYRKLPLVADALELYRAVAHLNPVILTGVPLGGWAEPQKIAWAAHHFPSVPMITCASREKFLHMRHTGDVLVDDYLRYKDLWQEAGGTFILHKTARVTLRQLKDLGFDIDL
jgi:hypothetical protein